jgi:DNA-binding response OmpR family regulator
LPGRTPPRAWRDDHRDATGVERMTDDQLDKPFSPAALGERVRRLLS